jgi:flagellar assembly protein FliH
MTHATNQPIDSVRVVPSADGAVLRGVVIGRDARLLPRPRTGGPAVPLPRPPDKPVLPVMQPPAVQMRGRGFQVGYEEGRQQGHAEGLLLGQEQGREEGLRAGLEQGRLAAQQEAQGANEAHVAARHAGAERLARLDALLSALPAELDRRLEQAEEEMLGLCFEAVARIVGGAAANPEGVRAIVRQAVTEAKSKEAATIRVNPRDLAFLQADEELAAWLGTSRRVQWRGDERIELGGCLVSAPDGGLDARLETQMARLATLFAKAREEKGE